jgi:hypothetical protein
MIIRQGLHICANGLNFIYMHTELDRQVLRAVFGLPCNATDKLYPSSNLNSARLVIARLKQELRCDYYRDSAKRSDSQRWYTVTFRLQHTKFMASGSDPSLSKAICKAALQFLEYFDEKVRARQEWIDRDWL